MTQYNQVLSKKSLKKLVLGKNCPRRHTAVIDDITSIINRVDNRLSNQIEAPTKFWTAHCIPKVTAKTTARVREKHCSGCHQLL